MPWWASPAWVALDAGSVCGARAGGWRAGSDRAAPARVDLERGALVPSPADPNLVRPAAVQAAIAAVLDRLGRPARATLLLPAGVARIFVLEVPPGTDAREYARFRLAPSLPYPSDEALVDVLPLETPRTLAAAVRRQVVLGYEETAAAAGLAIDRIDLLPMAMAAARLRERPSSRLDVVLGDAACSLLWFDDGRLRAFRTRWRDQGPREADRIAAEIERVWRAAPAPAVAPPVVVAGPGAERLAAELSARGHAARPGPELALLGAVA
jgi:hypothetical protein